MGFFPSIGLAHRYGLMDAKTAFLPGSQMPFCRHAVIFPGLQNIAPCLPHPL